MKNNRNRTFYWVELRCGEDDTTNRLGYMNGISNDPKSIPTIFSNLKTARKIRSRTNLEIRTGGVYRLTLAQHQNGQSCCCYG